MSMQSSLRGLVVAAFAVVALAAGTARAQEIPLVTGEHWVGSPEAVKKAYLVGIANVIQVEAALRSTNLPDNETFTPRVVRGLKGQTLDSVREGLDRWYAAHPDRLKQTVIETIWFEMVIPGLAR